MELLAPNGNKSNLTAEQYELVRTPEFKAWFGDWENDTKNASKVVDENGEPRTDFINFVRGFGYLREKMIKSASPEAEAHGYKQIEDAKERNETHAAIQKEIHEKEARNAPGGYAHKEPKFEEVDDDIDF